jgi:hypothetical protein
MPSSRARHTFTRVELVRLLRRIEDVLGEATRLRAKIARRLSALRANRTSRLTAARKTTARARR